MIRSQVALVCDEVQEAGDEYPTGKVQVESGWQERVRGVSASSLR